MESLVDPDCETDTRQKKISNTMVHFAVDLIIFSELFPQYKRVLSRSNVAKAQNIFAKIQIS